MKWIEVDFKIPESELPLSDMLVAILADSGFDMFEEREQEGILAAFLPQLDFNQELLATIDIINEHKIPFSIIYHEEKNWNKEWETNFQPVQIAGKVNIRATFHPTDRSSAYEIIIDPEMSFGTGHHETTSGMIEMMLETNFPVKSVCDMGCGTGILAIMAEKLGAKEVIAVDNDPQCIANTMENLRRNNCNIVSVNKGDATYLSGKQFDIILANINRNVLLADMHLYSDSLSENGFLILSGFYSSDLKHILDSAGAYQLKPVALKEKNNWAIVKFHKDQKTE